MAHDIWKPDTGQRLHRTYQRKRGPLACKVGEKRFTVLRIDYDAYDTHAGRSFESALRLANPDRGAHVEVFVTCAPDGGAARLPAWYQARGQRIREFGYRGRRR